MTKLITPVYGTSIIDSIFNEIVLRTSNYYFFIGRPSPWNNESAPPAPVDNEYNFKEVKKSAVYLKKITPSEISYLTRRVNWVANTVYDMYDDRYGTEVIGVNITSGGINYSNATANAVITGNGSNANVSVVVSNGSITRVIVNDPGIGYTTANVTFYGAPGTGANGTVVLGSSSNGKTKLEESNFYVLTDNFNVYKCLSNNKGGVSNTKPVLTTTDPFVTADGYKWKFMYRIPDALRNRFLSANYMPVVNSLTNNFYSNGSILSAIVVNSGNNYTSANTYIVVDGDGYLEGNKLKITFANVITGGDGFVTANLTVEPPFTSTDWIASTAVYAGEILKYQSNIYSVTATGVTSNVGPVHLSGTQTSGSASLKFLGNIAKLSANIVSNSIANVAIVDPGYGYFFTPNVTITGGANANVVITTTQTKANLVPIISNNVISGIQVVDGGIGYTYASANIIGDGSGAKAIIDFTTKGTDSLQTAVEQLAINGAIYSIQIISNGYNYTTANVTITGSGTGATASASVSNGRVTAINIIDPGSGYSEAEITITGDGEGASARAIIPPYGGHGKNAIRELYANKLGLYTTLFKFENRNFLSSNDYRQSGIIKNPLNYKGTELYNKATASACWLVTGTFNAVNFPVDTTMVQSSNGGKFTVVEVENGRMLLISQNGIAPEAGEVMTNNINAFSVATVLSPDVMAYSGDLLYVLNKEAFDANDEQLIAIKTILSF